MHLTSNRGSTFCTYQPECHCKVKGESEEEKGKRRRVERDGGGEGEGRGEREGGRGEHTKGQGLPHCSFCALREEHTKVHALHVLLKLTKFLPSKL